MHSYNLAGLSHPLLTDLNADHPVRDRLPPGFNTAFRIVKDFIDPGLQCDAYADEPWLYGPSLSCWFAFRVGEKVEDEEDFPEPGEEDVTREGADGSGQQERERLGLPENNEKRRKFFLDAKNRESFVFRKGRCYQADFFNPYLDFGNCALKLPGFSLNVIKYVDQKSHCLRYVFKNRDTGDVYVNVNIALLWDHDLTEAMEADKQGDAALQATIGGEKSSGSLQHDLPKGDGERIKGGSGDSSEQDISTRTDGIKLDSEHISDKQEVTGNASATTNGTPQKDRTATTDTRHSLSGLTAVESVSDSKSPMEATASRPDRADAQSQEIESMGEQTGEVRDMLQATATSDKRGSEAGIF